MKRTAPDDARASAPNPLAAVGRGRAVAAVAVALSLFLAPALAGDGEFAYRDNGRMHSPVKRWIAAELRAGRFPQWNPYLGLGVPVVGNAIDAVQHPFNVLLAAFPGGGLKAWVLASFAMAAAAAFALARALGMSNAASAMAAIAYALSGPLVSSSDNVTYLTAYAALPLLFAAAHRHAARGGPGPLALVAAASAACAAAGDPQSWGIAVALLPLFALAVAGRGGSARALARGGAAALVAVLAAAPFVLPVLAWAPSSVRAGGLPGPELTRWNVHPRRWLELIVPDLFRADPRDPVSPVFTAYAGNDVTPIPWFLSIYLGAATAALAGLGVAVDRRIRLLALAALPLAWAAMGHHAGFTVLAARAPLLGSFRFWEKATIWLALIVAIAAARGLDALAARDRPRGFSTAAGGAAGALLAAAALATVLPDSVASLAGGPLEAGRALAGNVASGAGRAGVALALVALLAARLGEGALGRLAPLGIAAIATIDLMGGNAGAYFLSRPMEAGRPPLAAPLGAGERVLAPFTARDDRWPRLDRVANAWRWSSRTLAPSWNVPLRIGSARDYVGLREARFAAVSQALGDGPRLAGLGMFGFAHLVVPGRPELSTRAGVAAPPVVEAEDPELPAWLVAIPHRPRAYVASAVASATADEALRYAESGGADGRTVVEGPVAAGYAAPAGEARVTGDLPGDTVVEATAGGRALVVLNDAFAPGWSATVDGRPAAIVRANGVVRGVWTDAGAHRLRFRYQTPGLLPGWAIAAVLAASLAAWSIVRRAWAGRTEPV